MKGACRILLSAAGAAAALLGPAAAGADGMAPPYGTLQRPYGKFGLNEIVVSDHADLKAQIRHCWRLPETIRDEDFEVHVRISLYPDGTVKTARVVDRAWIVNDPHRFRVAKSAAEALRSRTCNPPRLPEARPEGKGGYTLTFNPSAIFRR